MKENKNGKFDALEVAAYIVKKMNEVEGYLDHLKLQKLLYFVTLDWVKEFDIYPYKQPSEMWKLGPVVREVYSEYRINGYSQITEPPTTIFFKNGGIIIGKHEPADFSNLEKELVDRIIERFGKLNSFDLVDMTHEHNSWKRNENEIKKGVSQLEYTFEDLLEASKQV